MLIKSIDSVSIKMEKQINDFTSAYQVTNMYAYKFNSHLKISHIICYTRPPQITQLKPIVV